MIKSQHWLRGRVAYWPGHFHASVFKCPTFQEMECPHDHSNFETMISTISSDFRVFDSSVEGTSEKIRVWRHEYEMKLVQRSFVLHLRDIRLVQRFVFSNQCIPLIHFLLSHRHFHVRKMKLCWTFHKSQCSVFLSYFPTML